MAKRKGGDAVELKRLWYRGTDETNRKLAHLAIDLGIPAERLAGLIVADAVNKAAGNADALRKLVPPKPRE